MRSSNIAERMDCPWLMDHTQKCQKHIQLYGFDFNIEKIHFPDEEKKKKVENKAIRIKLFDFPWINLIEAEEQEQIIPTSMLTNPGSTELKHILSSCEEMGETNETSEETKNEFYSENNEDETAKMTETSTEETFDIPEDTEDMTESLGYEEAEIVADAGCTYEPYKSYMSCLVPMSSKEMLHNVQRCPLIIEIYESYGFINLLKFSKVVLRALVGPPYPILSTISADVIFFGRCMCTAHVTVTILCFGNECIMKVKLGDENPNDKVLNFIWKDANAEEDKKELMNLEDFSADRAEPEAIITAPENLMKDRKKEYVAPPLKPKRRFETEDINYCPAHRTIGHPKEKLTIEELRNQAGVVLGVKFERPELDLERDIIKSDEEITDEKDEEDNENEKEENIEESEEIEEEDKEEETEITPDMVLKYLEDNPKEFKRIKTILRNLNEQGEIPPLFLKPGSVISVNENEELSIAIVETEGQE